MLPLIFFISKRIINTNPKRLIINVDDILPICRRVEELLIISPMFFKPTKVISNPIPAGMAKRKDSGIACTIFSRNPEKVRIRNNIPEINTTPKAVRQSTPNPITTEYVKKLFNPRPGARAKGTFAHNPTIKVPIKDARQVIVIKALLSIPVSASMLGCRKII